MRHNLERNPLSDSRMFNLYMSSQLHYLPIRCFIGFNASVGEAEIYDMISFVAIRQGPLDSASIGETKVICIEYEVLFHI